MHIELCLLGRYLVYHPCMESEGQSRNKIRFVPGKWYKSVGAPTKIVEHFEEIVHFYVRWWLMEYKQLNIM